MTGPARTIHRVILPSGSDSDVLPLYVEFGAAPNESLMVSGAPAAERPREQYAENVVGRRGLRVPAGMRASFATYFNALPASYWRRWTVVEEVELQVRMRGPATVTVYRSTAAGRSERVASATTRGTDEQPEEMSFRLPLNRFIDGGWYWFDILGGRAESTLEQAEWLAVDAVGSPDRLEEPPGTLSLGITTFNRPTYLLDLVQQLGAAPDTMAVIDEILVVDQGTQKVRDQPGADEVIDSLGSTLRIVDQVNLGGSGGFARGMSEALQAGRSRYVLLLDDDVALEPECILRAATFADLCRQPTIVGAHMFNLMVPTRMHNFGEVMRPWRFRYAPARNTEPEHDFRNAGLRASPWMHRLTHVDYNGWWMCLIPIEVVKSIGLALPLFIKWDDTEYGVRAGKAGFPTVSLPGVAVWHMPWTDKDDLFDWQAYFHHRNQLVAALIHSPFERGGRIVSDSMKSQAARLVSMQYSVAHLRNKAMEDVLRGPEHLHATLASVLPEVRAIRATYADAQAKTDVGAFPPPRRRKPPRGDREPLSPKGYPGMLASGMRGVVRQLLPTAAEVDAHPQESVPAMDAKWWRLSTLDSAVVSSADGASAAWYRRDRAQFVEHARHSLELHQRLLAEWPQLSRRYREASADLVSPLTWSATFSKFEQANRSSAQQLP